MLLLIAKNVLPAFRSTHYDWIQLNGCPFLGMADKLYWPSPITDGEKHAVIVWTVMDFMHTFPIKRANQKSSIKRLICLSAMYGTPQVIERDQRTHFTDQGIQ